MAVAGSPYELTSNMPGCDSALCIHRAVTIEAEVAGEVVLNGMFERRVLAVGGATSLHVVAKLIGLTIQGGAVDESAIRDGGGVYVHTGAVANFANCIISSNIADGVACSLFEHSGPFFQRPAGTLHNPDCPGRAVEFMFTEMQVSRLAPSRTTRPHIM